VLKPQEGSVAASLEMIWLLPAANRPESLHAQKSVKVFASTFPSSKETLSHKETISKHQNLSLDLDLGPNILLLLLFALPLFFFAICCKNPLKSIYIVTGPSGFEPETAGFLR
jgi:hypothetical protein